MNSTINQTNFYGFEKYQIQDSDSWTNSLKKLTVGSSLKGIVLIKSGVKYALNSMIGNSKAADKDFREVAFALDQLNRPFADKEIIQTIPVASKSKWFWSSKKIKTKKIKRIKRAPTMTKKLGNFVKSHQKEVLLGTLAVISVVAICYLKKAPTPTKALSSGPDTNVTETLVNSNTSLRSGTPTSTTPSVAPTTPPSPAPDMNVADLIDPKHSLGIQPSIISSVSPKTEAEPIRKLTKTILDDICSKTVPSIKDGTETLVNSNTSLRSGTPKHFNIHDNKMVMKPDGKWKFINGVKWGNDKLLSYICQRSTQLPTDGKGLITPDGNRVTPDGNRECILALMDNLGNIQKVDPSSFPNKFAAITPPSTTPSVAPTTPPSPAPDMNVADLIDPKHSLGIQPSIISSVSPKTEAEPICKLTKTILDDICSKTVPSIKDGTETLVNLS